MISRAPARCRSTFTRTPVNVTQTQQPLVFDIHARYNAPLWKVRSPMPVYTYRCSSCGTRFEQHQSFDDAPLVTCPKCKKKALKKVITPTKVIFKGSGFYATDNKSSSGGNSSSRSKSQSDDHGHAHGEDKSASGDKAAEKSSSDVKGEKKSKSKTESKSE